MLSLQRNYLKKNLVLFLFCTFFVVVFFGLFSVFFFFHIVFEVWATGHY